MLLLIQQSRLIPLPYQNLNKSEKGYIINLNSHQKVNVYLELYIW